MGITVKSTPPVSYNSDVSYPCNPKNPLMRGMAQITHLQPPLKIVSSTTEDTWCWSCYSINTERRNIYMLASLVELKLMLEAETRLGIYSIAVSNNLIMQVKNRCTFGWFPFLLDVTINDYDERNPPFSIENAMVRKCYALADKLDINTKNLFCNNPETWLNDSKFHSLFLCDHLPFSWNWYAIRGQHEETLENMSVLMNAFLPVRCIVDINNTTVPLYLPGKEHLIGLDKMPAHGTIFLTPDCFEQSLNPQSISWIGDNDAAEADVVDLSPLFNRSVIYAVNSVTFQNDANRCLTCMETICRKLEANGCRIKLRDRKTDKIFDFEDRAEVYKAYNVPIPECVTDWNKVLSDQKTSEAPIYLVNKLLFHRDISIVYADAGIGKSWFINSLASALRCGSGLTEHFFIPKSTSTLIINGEMRQDELNKRNTVLEKMYPNGGEKNFSKSLRAPSHLDTKEGQAWLQGVIRQCNRHNPDCAPVSLVILDSLKTLTSDGESKRSWGSLFQFLDRMRTERDISFVIIQHENKTGQLYGTNDQKIKINGEFHLTRNVTDITPTDPSDNFKPQKKYQEFLEGKLMEWRQEHPNDIWFFIIPPKGRSMKPIDKRPVMLHFCPEDDPPSWFCIDFLDKDHPWSFHAFQKVDNSELKEQRMPSEGNQPESIPTYKTLLAMPKETVVQWLKKAQENSSKSRKSLGHYFGVKKDQIDYLMKKNGLQNADLEMIE